MFSSRQGPMMHGSTVTSSCLPSLNGRNGKVRTLLSRISTYVPHQMAFYDADARIHSMGNENVFKTENSQKMVVIIEKRSISITNSYASVIGSFFSRQSLMQVVNSLPSQPIPTSWLHFLLFGILCMKTDRIQRFQTNSNGMQLATTAKRRLAFNKRDAVSLTLSTPTQVNDEAQNGYSRRQ